MLIVRAPNQEDGQTGYTLIELVAGLGLIALLSAVLTASIWLSLQTLEKVRARAEAADDVAAAQRALRGLLERAHPLLQNTPGQQGEVSFTGSRAELIFLIDTPGASGAYGLYEIRLAASLRGATRAVAALLRRAPSAFEQSDDASSALTETTLLKGVVTLSFRYYGRLTENAAPTWMDVWERRDVLPDLIDIRVAFPAGDLRHWPPLVVEPRLDPFEVR